MIDTLQLENAKKLRDAIDLYHGQLPVQTPFDHLCYIAMEFSRMVLDQHIAEQTCARRNPPLQDRGS